LNEFASHHNDNQPLCKCTQLEYTHMLDLYWQCNLQERFVKNVTTLNTGNLQRPL